MDLALLAVAVFISAAAIDYAEARYVRAVQERRAHLAARWSLTMWGLGCLGFVAMLRVSLWLMLPEGLGFYLGTLVAVRGDRPLRTRDDMSQSK
jgi:hypothetical protein